MSSSTTDGAGPISHQLTSATETSPAATPAIDALLLAGCERIFQDEGISGAATDRPALNEALAALVPGDVLVTWKLDRLGRSLAHLIGIISRLEAEGIGFRSLSEAIDTTTASGRLLFHVMGALAEFERALISERTPADMAAAKARGRHLGRDRKITDEVALWARQTIVAGRASCEVLAKALGVAPVTVFRSIERIEAQELSSPIHSMTVGQLAKAH